MSETSERPTGDAFVRAAVNDFPVYEFESRSFAVPKPLSESRVAIVTTAGLRTSTDLFWASGDQSFTVIPDDSREVHLAHMSPNFDRTGFVQDRNVVFPVDRLHEMAALGVIGSVAPRHISFMGAQPDHTLATMRLDTGPAAAQMLRDDGVDVVLLTPV